MPIRFPIRVGSRSAPLLRVLFGVRANDAWIELGDGPEADLVVHFGWYTFRAPLSNVTGWQIEGPWRWITAIGVRMSIRHGDVTFGGNADGGVRIDFRTAVRWRIFHVPAIYVSVHDLDGLAAELARRGFPGRDARKARA